MSSITITQKTTLAELQQFAQGVGDNEGIKAKKNEDGSYALYTAPKSSGGPKPEFTGLRTGQQAAARDAVGMVLGSVKGSHVDLAMRNLLEGLKDGDLTGAMLKKLLADALAVRQQGASIAIPADEIAGLMRDAVATGNADAIEAATAKLGDKVAEKMREKSHEKQLDFATSRGDQLKSRLLEQLVGKLDGPGALGDAITYDAADPTTREILDGAYDRAVQNLSNRRVDANTIRLADKDSPTGYTDFVKDRNIAKGGYGSVDAYKAADGREVVVKSPILAKNQKASDKFDEAAREITAHRAATAGKPDNIVGLTAALRTADGGLELVLPMMPNGTAQDMAENMHQLKADGGVPPRQATMALLTMLKDMAEGTKQLHANGVISLDNKAPNVLIGADGVGRLSDFGTAAPGGQVRSVGGRMVDNPTWLAPEMIEGWEKREDQMGAMQKQHKAERSEAMTALKDAGFSEDQRQVALTDITKNQKAREEAAHRFDVTVAADTWSFGVDLYKFLTNQYPFESEFMSDIETQVKSHAQFGGQISLPEGVDLGLKPEETREANKLLAGLLEPDPTKRMTISQALQSPLFALAGVGSPEARGVIKLAATMSQLPPLPPLPT